MLYKSALMTSASGSIGGLTAAHNRGGQYFRGKVVPSDKFTPAQRRARQSMRNVAPDFAALSEPDKESWQSYGQRIKRTGKLGGPLQLTAQQMYMRSALVVKNALETNPVSGVSMPDTAPAGGTLPAFSTSPVLDAASEGTQQVSVTFDNSEAWANEDGAFMSVQIGAPQGAGRNHFKGPFQAAGVVFGNLATPPTSPQNFNVPFPVKEGQKVWIRIVQFRVDGSASSPLIEGPIVVGV